MRIAGDLARGASIFALLAVADAALQPSGSKSLEAASDCPSWNGTLKATSFGLTCPSTAAGDDIGEDCLTVNIWSPATSADAKLPVMFWSYAAGSGSSASVYVGGGMAGKDIVFVSYNYRVGALDWLTLSELEEETGVTGNYILLDSIAALKWVHENIAAFGGDPDAITAAGQSFGAGMSYHLLNSHLSKGLIKGAIAESGIKDPYDPNLYGYGSDYHNMSTLLEFSNTFVDSLNISSLAELRAYIVSLEEGAPNNVPVLVGNAAAENGIDLSTTYNVSAYEEAIKSLYGKYANELLDLYLANTTAEATNAYNEILRAGFCTSTWSYADRWSKTSDKDIYYYLWTYSPSSGSGPTHGSEVVFALDNLYAQSSTYNQTDYEVAAKMSAYWANYVKTQNPNKGGSATETLPYWAPDIPSENNQFELGNLWKKIPITPFATEKNIFLDFWQWAIPDPF
ncbi:uncharacterized protein N7484_001140 [Penicillium longicatenatum]|uniref:uncharacterized protein n=1 Tax=Penicillium longicatenatum TaxID=1561947 RepID=UPI0025479199|nr:uncharacterized protein N7484_001140 [Penicillium longicatenatum]KAJ5657491.1 hypothetical protein N7484_001140 [Penicillium longicatenatum]